MSRSGEIYFASDFHLGFEKGEAAIARERRVVRWLESVGARAGAIYLLGDIFDYWYEYRYVVPRGFTRFLGAVAQLVDSGVEVHFFTGNHDVWMFDYLGQELGVQVHRGGEVVELLGKRFYLCHGDGLGPGDWGYKAMQWAFHNGVLQWLFSRVHPNFSMWLGKGWSRRSRYGKHDAYRFHLEGSALEVFLQRERQRSGVDAFVMGHLHVPVLTPIAGGGQLLVLGDWIWDSTYGVWDGAELRLCRYGDGMREAEAIGRVGL